jgi:hypothetical protein
VPGRPTKYKKKYVKEAEKACSIFGADDNKLAKWFEVNQDTIYEWKKIHQEFSEAIKTGKDIYDTENVEKSLLRRAMGYQTIETHEEACNEKGCKGTRIKTVTKWVVSDTAIIFWLKNRNPQRWRDIKAVQVKSDNVTSIRYEFSFGSGESKEPDKGEGSNGKT